MTRILKNESNAAKRVATMFINLDDGATPANSWTDFTGFVYVGTAQDLAAAAGSIVNRRVPWSFADKTFTSAASTDQLTSTAHGIATGWGPFRLTTTGTLSTGTSTGVDYYAIFVDANNIKVASSYANAIAGTTIDLTTDSSGTCKITATGTSPKQGLPGVFQYTFTQTEVNVSTDELTAIIFRSGYAMDACFVGIEDTADQFDVNVKAIDPAAVVSIWEGTGAQLEGSYTGGDLLRFVARWLGGKATDFRTNTITIRDLLDTKNCIVVTVDDSGRIGLNILDPS